MKIYVKGNFLVLEDSLGDTWIDNLENVLMNITGLTSYALFMNGINKVNHFVFSDVDDENGNAYASQSVFEEYIYQNTGVRFQQPLIELDDLNDVVISAPSNGQSLVYNSTTSKWENTTSSATGGDMTKAVYDADGDGVVDSAERLEFVAKNSTGLTIAKTKVVYISGATGQKPNITLAGASMEISSSKTIGITRDSIANNNDGYVITHGKIHNIDTSSFADGDSLWLSETAGEFTTTIPAEPAHSVFIGYVAYAHATQGKIILHIQNGYELDELHGVKITTPLDKQLLRYNNSTTLWENVSADSSYISNFTTQVQTDAPAETTNTVGSLINGATAKTTPVDADMIGLMDSASSNVLKKLSWLNLKATLKSYFDTLYASISSSSIVPSYTPHETFRGVQYANNSTTETTYGGITISTTGSATARSVSTTNYATRQIRKGFVASVVSSGRYTETRGSALLWYVSGGFRYVCDVYISDTAYASGCRQFYGMMGQTTSLTYSDVVNVDTMLNVIGFGSDSADTNLQVFHNDGSGTCTKIDLGSSFPANRSAGSALTAMYSLELYNGYDGNVLYKATNNETGVSVEGTISTNLPATTQGLNFIASRCMGGGGGVTNSGQFDLGMLGVYSI